MAKDEEQNQSQDTNPQAREAAEEEGGYEGSSNVAYADNEGAAPEEELNDFSSVEEAERQKLEALPRSAKVQTFDGHEDLEKARYGAASTHRSTRGRVVVVDEDTEHDGEIYKAGVQDLPLDVADALIGEGVAFEPAGKKQGR